MYTSQLTPYVHWGRMTIFGYRQWRRRIDDPCPGEGHLCSEAVRIKFILNEAWIEKIEGYNIT